MKYLPKDCIPIEISDPYLGLAVISNLFNDQNLSSNGLISNNSSIDPSSKIKKMYKLIHLLLLQKH